MAESQPTQPAAALVERMPKREMIVVESKIPTLDTAMFEHMQRIATMMAQSSLVPAHLNSVKKVGGQEVEISAKEAIANCFLVVNQAIRWNMDPFAAAQSAYTTKGKLGWEGKMIAAVINSHPLIAERLSYTYSGSGDQRKVVVAAKLKGENAPRTVEGTVASWRTTGSGSPWDKQSQWDQQLSYRGAREWGRRHLPEAMLGVYGDDEIVQFEATERTLAGEQHQPQAPQQRGGAAALKQHLAAGASAATDAVVVDETKKGEKDQKPAEPAGADAAAQAPGEAGAAPGPSTAETPAAAASEKKGKPAATLANLEHYLGWFKRAKDADDLALARDDARQFDWADGDRDSLDAEYSKRQDELSKPQQPQAKAKK